MKKDRPCGGRDAGALVRAGAIALVWLVTAVSPAFAHEVTHRVENQGAAVVVTLGYADGTIFSYESVEIFRPGESVPFQVGRTDALGRVTFLPDRAGAWRLKAFSEEGHGVDFTLETDAAGAVVASGGGGLSDRYPRLIGGLAILLGAFGLMSLFYGRGKG